jgi:hypothetical protein
MNSVDLANNLINRARSLQKFDIVRDVPENFLFNGRQPYDIKMNRETMTVTVHAMNLAEANAMVDKYLDDNSATEW